MFRFSRRPAIAAACAALVMSSVFVGAAVGPAEGNPTHMSRAIHA